MGGQVWMVALQVCRALDPHAHNACGERSWDRTCDRKCRPHGPSARTVRADGPHGSARTVHAGGPRGWSARTVRADDPRGRSTRMSIEKTRPWDHSNSHQIALIRAINMGAGLLFFCPRLLTKKHRPDKRKIPIDTVLCKESATNRTNWAVPFIRTVFF